MRHSHVASRAPPSHVTLVGGVNAAATHQHRGQHPGVIAAAAAAMVVVNGVPSPSAASAPADFIPLDPAHFGGGLPHPHPHPHLHHAHRGHAHAGAHHAHAHNKYRHHNNTNATRPGGEKTDYTYNRTKRKRESSNGASFHLKEKTATSMAHHSSPEASARVNGGGSNQQQNKAVIIGKEEPRTNTLGGASLQSVPGGVSAVSGGNRSATRDSSTPWSSAKDRVYSPGVVGLHEEIEDFFQWMLPQPQEHALRNNVIGRIRSVILREWPNARVEIFGSFKTGLYLPTSDIDLVVYGKWPSLPLRSLEKLLLDNNIVKENSIKVLDKATVPIIKLTDRLTNIKVDISFNLLYGVQAAELIKIFKRRFPPLTKLIYVLKQFLLQRDLNEVFTGGLSSYLLILLVVSFLQHHPRASAAHAHNANLGVLLVEFLEYYGKHFNPNTTAIQINDGGRLVPRGALGGVGGVGGVGVMAPSNAVISIQDPIDPDNDVGRSSFGYVFVQQAFERGYIDLVTLIQRVGSGHGAEASGKGILSQIISVSKEVLDYREWVRKEYENSARSPDPSDLTLPSRLPVTNSKDVEPKQIPANPLRRSPEREEKRETPRTANPQKSGPTRPAELKKPVMELAKPVSEEVKPVLPPGPERNEAENEDSDSVCSVSSGRASSVLTTASSDSATSNEDRARLTHERLSHHNSHHHNNPRRGGNNGSTSAGTSDTDSDVILGEHPSPSISPTSAMSISPASSEVGSLKSQLSPRSAASSIASALIAKSQNAANAANGRHYKSGRKNRHGLGHNHGQSDLDHNWRSSARSSARPAEQTSVGGVVSGGVSSGTSAHSSPAKSRAENDTNWRRKKEEGQGQGQERSRTVSNGSQGSGRSSESRKSKKHQDKKDQKSSASVVPTSSTTPVVSLLDNRVPSPVVSNATEVTAKDRLTAGLVARDADNNDVTTPSGGVGSGVGGNDGDGDDELDNGKNIPVVSVGTKKASGNKKRRKKRTTHHGNGGSSSAAHSSANSSSNSVVLDELDNGADLVAVNASNRFSHGTGLCKPNR